MDQTLFSSPLPLKAVEITEGFWKREMELIRKEVIPYQWEALNDRVDKAPPSFCMRNFKIAGKLIRERKETKSAEPSYTYRGFESLPEDPENLEDRFYGFVFQDSDFYKWIEAVGYSLSQYPDPELEKTADEAIDIVCAAQQEDGYLDTYYVINGRDKSFTNLKDHHELYCFGHLIEGAVSYYQATGKDRLLNAAKRFADYIVDYFGPEEGKCKGYPGHEIAEMALVRLYEVTGEEKYLNLGRFFIEERGKRPYYFDKEQPDAVRKGKEDEDDLRYAYYQAHLPVREQKEAVGHAVRAVYLYSGMADMARLTCDETLFDACKTLWNSIVNQKMYITGGIGGTHVGEAFSFAYDLPNDTAYAETCASVGLVFFARRMLEIRPKAGYADVMELALYNGVLSGMSLDGKRFFYVNPLEVNPEACHKDERKFHVKPIRQKWLGCACCPPNLARLLSSIGSYAYTENKDTLFIHLYMDSRLTKRMGEQTAEVCVESGFPWDGKVKIHVRAKGSSFRLAVRIPGWCGTFEILGCDESERTVQDGYLYIKKEWDEEECLELNFPMEVKFIAANPMVRENAGKAAVMRGSVVYCMEEADNGKNLHLLSVDPRQSTAVIDDSICGTAMKSILLHGCRDSSADKAQGLYHVWSEEKKEAAELKLIPYYMWANRMENEMQVWMRTCR